MQSNSCYGREFWVYINEIYCHFIDSGDKQEESLDLWAAMSVSYNKFQDHKMSARQKRRRKSSYSRIQNVLVKFKKDWHLQRLRSTVVFPSSHITTEAEDTLAESLWSWSCYNVLAQWCKSWIHRLSCEPVGKTVFYIKSTLTFSCVFSQFSFSTTFMI